MHKRILVWVVISVALATGILWTIKGVRAQETTPWINSPLLLQVSSPTLSVPARLNGNIDCYNEDVNNCAIPTFYGTATQNGTARLNETPDYKPVYSYVDNRQHFLPIPNSNTAITYTTEPAYGFYLNFNYNFPLAISKVSNPSPAYQINKPPEGKLADRNKQRLAADYGSMSFSSNGDWMIVSEPNVAMLRVNLKTFEALPFAPGFNYTIGVDPNLKTAITNDGRYAVVASKEFDTFKLYDLSTCGAVPNSISGPVDCQYRDLKNFLRQEFPGYSFVDQAKFLDNFQLSIYANYIANNASKTSEFRISANGTPGGIEYLAVGDSYISGEGAFDYQGGTDVLYNKCHLSLVSYPYLIGEDLNYDSYHSVACSGAITADITNRTIQDSNKGAQAKGKNDPFYDDQIYSSFIPGYRAQINFIAKYQPKSITVSIIGNDVNMIGKLKGCFEPGTCFSTYEDRLEFVHEVNAKFSTLVSTYSQIKSAGPPDMRVYAIGYPRIAKPGGDCAVNVRLDSDEAMFTQQALDYLDTIIKSAADKAGVFYVNTNPALEGHRLCEAGPGSVAVNGTTAGNEIPARLNGPIGSESFHPNQMGHELLENSILKLTGNLTAPMPLPSLSVSLPSENTLEILNAPHSGRPVNHIEFDNDISNDLVYQQEPLDISIDGLSHSLGASTSLKAELHSTPLVLGTYSTNNNGNLKTTVTIPSEVPAGYHSLHFYGTDLSGQSIDIYKDIYVAHSADDMDGNGIADSNQACVGIESANQDYDGDSIDDACDANITQPPSTQEATGVTGTVSSQTQALVISTESASNESGLPKTTTEIKFTEQDNKSAVLGATTSSTDKGTPSVQADNLRIPGYYFSGSGLAIFVISAMGYAIKSWIF